MSNYIETMKNAEEYLKKADLHYPAKIIGGGGYSARVDLPERSYFILIRIDKAAEIVIMEISPSIHCETAARTQVSDFLIRINEHYKSCDLRLSENGNIYIHAEQRFDDSPLSERMFDILKGECLSILDTFAATLEKLAHLILPMPAEINIEALIKEHIKKVSVLSAKYHGDDDDDGDIAPIFPISSPPGFEEWLRKKRVLKDDGESPSTEEEKDETKPSSLLDELMSLDEETGEEG